MKRDKHNLGTIGFALAALFAASFVRAQDSTPDHPMMQDRFYIGGGVLWAESNVTANLNTGAIGAGAIIDFEDDVGLDEESLIGLVTFRMHLSKRWQIEAEYFSLDRDNARQTSRTIEWGDLSIPVNISAKGEFDIQDIRLGIGYSFFRTQDKELGFGIGAHVTKIEASLTTQNFGSERASQSAPLPFFNFYARVALTDRWLLSVRVDRLSLDTGNVDGSIFSSGTDVIYQPWRHFSIGLGYRDINFQVSSTSEDWRGEAQIQQSGPYLFIASTF
jgi:hypothetical protein